MRKLLYILSGFLLVVFMALFFVPRFVDLNQYKGQIESEVSKVLEREVKIEGKISLSLLPFPSVSINEIRLANDARSTRPDMLKIKRVSASVSWLPLLMKKISVQHIQFVKPEIVLEKYADGKANWDFLLNLGQKDESKATLEGTQEEAGATDFDVQVSRIDIEDGSIKYIDGKTEVKLDAINVQVSADDIVGPYDIKGGLKFEDQPVTLEVTTGALSPETPSYVSATLAYAKHQLKLEGSFDQKATQFKGKLEGTLQTEAFAPDLATRFGKSVQVSAETTVDLKHVALSGMVTANKNEIVTRVNLDLQGPQNYLIELKKLPGHTNLSLKGSLANMNPLSGQIDVQSAQFGKFLTWAKVDVKDLPKPVLSRVSLKAGFRMQESEWTLSGLTLNVGEARMTGDLTWKAPLIKLNVETPKIGPWLAIAKMQPKLDMGRVRINGSLKGDMKKMQVNTTVEALHGKFKADGQLKDLAGATSYALSLDVDHPNINKMMQGLGMDDLPVALGRIKLQAKVDGNPSQVKISNLTGSIAPKGQSTSIAGQATYRFAAKRPQLEFDLKLGKLSLDNLMAAAAKEIHLAQAGNAQMILASAKSSSAGSSFKGWSRDPIDVSGLNAIDAKGKLTITSLVYDPYVLDNVSMDITLTNGTLTIPNFKSGVFGGTFTGKMTLQAGKTAPSLSLDSKLQGASLKKLIGKGSRWDITGGSASADLHVTTAGKTQEEMVAHLNGAINFDVRNATLIGVDYGALTKSLIQLTNPAGLLRVFEAVKGGRTTKVNFKGRFNIVNGVARAQGVQFTSPPANGTAQGEINLPQYNADLKANITLTALKDVPVVVRYHGPLDALEKSYNLDQLTGHLFRQVGGKLINRLIGGAVAGPAGAVIGVPGLPIPIPGLGGGGSSGDQQEPPSSDSKDQKSEGTTPDKAIRGVLRGLFRK